MTRLFPSVVAAAALISPVTGGAHAASHAVHRHQAAPPLAARVTSANHAATREPTAAAFNDATQVYRWAEGAIYHVLTAPERVTDLALEPGETLGAVASGDTARWIIGDTTSGSSTGKRTHVLVKPVAAGLATNLVITTDRRSYHIVLTSTVSAAMTAISWTYPRDALIALQAKAAISPPTSPSAPAFDPDRLNFAYAISGDHPAWRPLRAFDDGRQTFIEFPPTLAVGEAPPLFLIGRDQAAQLVNYRVHGRFYIVDRLFDRAELRLGTKHQTVVRIRRQAPDARRRAS